MPRKILCKNFQIRKTKTVSAFPVGFVGDAFLSTPILDKNGKFVRFHDGWIADRTYPMDMAGFAVGVDHELFLHFHLRVDFIYSTQIPFRSSRLQKLLLIVNLPHDLRSAKRKAKDRVCGPESFDRLKSRTLIELLSGYVDLQNRTFAIFNL